MNPPSATVALVATLVAPALARGEAFVVDGARSSVRVHVGKSGLLSFAGHRHEVAAPVTGTVVADREDLGASSVELAFPTARFEVVPEGEPEGDAAVVQETMRGPRVLDVLRFPEVRFRSRQVSGHAVASRTTGVERFEVRVTGRLAIHGQEAEVAVPLEVDLEGDTLRVRGRCTIRHDQFGLKPVTAGAGTVRVRNEIGIEFAIVARRRR
jgi:polyisoprenoid-binding protein YceI